MEIARLQRLREKLSSERIWEGHEFHSCRNCHRIDGGFQPLRSADPQKYFFSKLFSR